jgi:hypothetical protein
MHKFEVTELARGNDLVQWDELVSHSSQGTIFHTSGWLDACARSLGKKVKIFGCFQNAQLVGGCSLFLEKKFGIIPLASSACSMTPYGGFVISSSPHEGAYSQESFFREIVESLIHEIKKEHFFTITIRNSPEFLDVRPFTWDGWRSRVFYAYYINLENNPESHPDRSMKKNIRKAEKNRIIIEPFSDISRYYALLCEMYAQRSAKPPAPERLFTELYKLIRDQHCGEMVVARTSDDEIACGEIHLWDTRMAYGWSAVSDSRFLDSGATSLLRFDGLKRLKERGIPNVNIMMANIPRFTQSALHLNPKLVPYYQVQTRIFDDISRFKT